jgi:hypothetical protein
MKLAALATMASWMLMGTTVGTSASIVQYGALGLLSFVVVWFCMKGFPAILKSQRDERNALIGVINELKQEIRVLNERNRRK